MRLARWMAAFALGVALTGCAGLYLARWSGSRPVQIAVPEESALQLVAALDWRAERPDFGGFSALEVAPDGTLLTLTDKAHWARARMRFDGAGRLTAIDDLRMGRLKNARGQPLDDVFYDSESIGQLPDGAYVIGFENRHRLLRFNDLTGNGVRYEPQPDLTALGINSGIESLLALPDGRLILIAENSPDATGDLPGWIIGEAGIERFGLRRHGWFAPTDLALGPGGETVFLLERRFTVLGGFAMRIRRFPLAKVAPGARIGGEELIRLENTDNFEGLAVLSGKDGDLILFAISDDNFRRRLQRTLLLQFHLPARLAHDRAGL